MSLMELLKVFCRSRSIFERLGLCVNTVIPNKLAKENLRYSNQPLGLGLVPICSRFYCSSWQNSSEVNILGIETSCDDTGVAVVNGCGKILGERLYSQTKTSVKLGGVLPSIAKKYHEQNIKLAVEETLHQSNLSPNQLTAVAATVKPGLFKSLAVGCEFGKQFALQHNLPFIPIHHMEAHGLTVRMEHKVSFPFLVLLLSGGHCILAIAHAIDEWSIIGETIDLAPGNAVDQVARRLKLKNVSSLDGVSSGRAVEIMAKEGDPKRYSYTQPLVHYRDVNFCFSGLYSRSLQLIHQLEIEKGIEGGRVLDEAKDICASFQHGLVQHIVRRTHRGINFVEVTERITEDDKTLVVSGGVASNLFLREALEKLCNSEGYKLLFPPTKLCTDNGVMIAWNGVERWNAQKGVLYDAEEINGVTVESVCPLGASLSNECKKLDLKNPKWIKI